MILIDFVLVLIIANVIPLILRFVIFRRQLSKLASIIIIIPVLFINIIFLAFIQDYDGSSYIRGTSSLGPAAVISYLILRKGNKPKDEPENDQKTEVDKVAKPVREGTTIKRTSLVIAAAILGVLLISAISSVLFYWFQWRPNEVRKVCVEESVNRADKEVSGWFKALAPEEADKKIREKANNFYRECLVKQGMKPESLFTK